MIEITPIATTHPIKKINKVDRERQKQPDKKQTQEDKINDKDDGSDDTDQQHIDEVV